MDINPVLNSVITIFTTAVSSCVASVSFFFFSEYMERRKKAKLFLYKLEEIRNYLLLIKYEIKNPRDSNNHIDFGLSANESVNLLLENKVPDDLSIFDESMIQQIAKYSFAIKRFTFEFQKFLGDKEEETLRNIMAIRADEAIIEVNLCILIFLVKYFGNPQKSETNKLKSDLKRKYRELKNDRKKKLEESTLATENDSGDNSTSSVMKCEYYSEYSIQNIERVFKSLNWDINQ